ncbi:STAS domain-containing protein [Microbispora sp. NPDC049125]|uniref:STAS domain-containing protein n=1 Tax=Microbispora sp. NPDC049125 TaxID=3154929 RepID=UPI0034650FFC
MLVPDPAVSSPASSPGRPRASSGRAVIGRVHGRTPSPAPLPPRPVPRAQAAPAPAVPPYATVVRLEGAIDIFTSHALRGRLLRALETSTKLLVCDLAGVSSCDTGGVAVLIGIQRRARSLGVTVALAAPGPQMLTLLRVTGLDGAFTVYGNVPGSGDGGGAARLPSLAGGGA